MSFTRNTFVVFLLMLFNERKKAFTPFTNDKLFPKLVFRLYLYVKD